MIKFARNGAVDDEDEDVHVFDGDPKAPGAGRLLKKMARKNSGKCAMLVPLKLSPTVWALCMSEGKNIEALGDWLPPDGRFFVKPEPYDAAEDPTKKRKPTMSLAEKMAKRIELKVISKEKHRRETTDSLLSRASEPYFERRGGRRRRR